MFAALFSSLSRQSPQPAECFPLLLLGQVYFCRQTFPNFRSTREGEGRETGGGASRLTDASRSQLCAPAAARWANPGVPGSAPPTTIAWTATKSICCARHLLTLSSLRPSDWNYRNTHFCQHTQLSCFSTITVDEPDIRSEKGLDHRKTKKWTQAKGL